MVGTYWDDLVRSWPYKTREQKVRIREVVQKKIEERLRVDASLFGDGASGAGTAANPNGNKSSGAEELHSPLQSFTFLSF